MVILYHYMVFFDPMIVFFLEADFLFKSILRHCVPARLFGPAQLLFQNFNYLTEIMWLDLILRILGFLLGKVHHQYIDMVRRCTFSHK